jgi:hypothetical protein
VSKGSSGSGKDGLDTYLGTRGLQEGQVTPDQLKEALAERSRDASRRKAARSLGAILVAKGFLSHGQLQSLVLARAGETRPLLVV